MPIRPIGVIICSLALAGGPASAEDWPEFRGPTGQGLYFGKNLPVQWSTTSNAAWVVDIPGLGWSSPIVLRGRVYLTTATPIPGTKDHTLQALCLDAATGRRLWLTDVFRQDGAKAPRIHSKNSHASPTPLTDGKRLFVHFGHQGTAGLDLDGKILWTNNDHRYAPVHGNGGSPILVDDKLVFSCDGRDQQFIVALVVATGKLLWKTDRRSNADRKFSFSTPLLIQADGRRQIISPASDAVIAYHPDDGRELWRAAYEGYSVVPRPVFGHGMVFLSTGYDVPKVLAIRTDGTGDVTQTHIVWTLQKGAPHTPSPLLVDTELYLVSDAGLVSCLDARSGKIHWQERAGGRAYSASPLYAEGKIYLQSEEGLTTVLKAGTTFERLAESSVGERTYASLAVADGAIFLRTETKLYRLERQ
ncbi:MAG: PQQ-binding-like beta-propeller repeat protein [Gemmataceae bacterium]|nr:PQQ-binding-like beta-propeller repeat protein [Gemmataceae bacterium]